MKIKQIKLKEKTDSIYEVTFVPNWLEKFFGVKEVIKEYKKIDYSYHPFTRDNVYIDQKGKRLNSNNKIAKAIDAHLKPFYKLL